MQDASDARAESGSNDWSVEVTDGPNKGAILLIEPGALKFGSGIENDIVLADGEVAGEQAVLELTDGGAHLEALSPGLTVDGSITAPGRSVVVTDGMVLRAGATTMTVRGPKAPARRWRWLFLIVPAALSIGLAAALSNLSSGRRVASCGDGGVGCVAPPHPVPPPADQARAALQARLVEAGLADRVTLRVGAGAVIAEGTLATADKPRWHDQQLWFDTQYKGSLSLVNHTADQAEAERPNIKLRAVSTGPLPYIIVQNGDRFVEGAMVDGWTIDQIAPDKVTFSKDGHTFVITL